MAEINMRLWRLSDKCGDSHPGSRFIHPPFRRGEEPWAGFRLARGEVLTSFLTGRVAGFDSPPPARTRAKPDRRGGLMRKGELWRR